MQHFSFLNLDIPLFKEGLSYHVLSRKSIAMLDYEKFINVDILKFFDSLNLKLFLVETFFKNPGETGSIHIDAMGGDYTKLNWVFGGGESKMCWYEPLDKTLKPIFKTATGTPYIAYTANQVREIEKVKIQNPTLVQVGIPHDVLGVTEDRFCVSFVFKDKTTNKRLTMEESRTLFKDFLYKDLYE
jgi:hypothetical protein